jgi:hypothetical protein
MDHMDIFNDDAFSLVSMVAAINEIDHVPGRAGDLAFAGAGEGVAVTTVSIEMKGESLSLIQTSARGGPAPKETQDKANIRAVSIPHIKLEDTIGAAQIQGVRQFGSTDLLRGAQSVVNGQMLKMTRRHDLTLEHLRLGALKGLVSDADGSEIVDIYDLFGVTPQSFELPGSSEGEDDLRIRCQEISRHIRRKAKMVLPSGARVWAFCGDEFFDNLISREDVKRVYTNTDEQRVRLGGNYAFGAFEFGGIAWENYQGTDDIDGEEDSEGALIGKVGVAANEARLFLTGVPGLYAEYFAPGDFMETVNTIGLPRYAKLAPDQKFNRFIELHTQQNPLPLCLRPQTLVTVKL